MDRGIVLAGGGALLQALDNACVWNACRCTSPVAAHLRGCRIGPQPEGSTIHIVSPRTLAQRPRR
jgi:hypothetical protein